MKDKRGRMSSIGKAANTENGYGFALIQLVCGLLVSFPADQDILSKAVHTDREGPGVHR